MNDKMLLTKSIVLLQRESLLQEKDNTSNDMVRTVLERVKVQENMFGLSSENEIITGLKKQAIEMANNPQGTEYNKDDLLQTLKLIIKDDENLYDVIYSFITADLKEKELKTSIIGFRRSLDNYFKRTTLTELLYKAYGDLKHNSDKIKDSAKWVREFISTLEPYDVNAADKDTAIIDEVDLDDIDAMDRVYASIQLQADATGSFICGWQDINAMVDGGFRRGEGYVTAGLQHNYKTGWSLAIFADFCYLNKPVLKDKNKKPLLVRISFEDPLQNNFQQLYKWFYENETGEVLSKRMLKETPKEKITQYVHEKLTATGFSVKLLYVDPSSWTYKDLFNKIMAYEAEGYEVQVLMLDYLLKMSTAGCKQGAAGQDVRNLYEKVLAFCKAKNIMFITPHQLSTEAKQRMRDGTTSFVKGLVGGGFYADCKQIDQVIDVEFFHHIERHKDAAYFTVQRGKLRRVEQVDDDKLYRVYKFVRGGVIPRDYGKPNSARLKVGGPTVAEINEEKSWNESVHEETGEITTV